MSENSEIGVSDVDAPDRVSRLAATLAHDVGTTDTNTTNNGPLGEEDQTQAGEPNGRSGDVDFATTGTSIGYPPRGVTAGAVANLCSATLGAGVLAVPYSMAQAGVWGSVGLLAVAAGATLVSIRYLVQAVAYYQCDSYEQLTRQLFGNTACHAVQLCIVLFCEGCAVAYLIAVADIMEQADLLFHESRTWTLTIIWATVCVPLSMLRRVQTLQFTSALGVASIATLLFAALVHFGQDLDEEYHHNGNGTNYTNHTTAATATNDLSYLTTSWWSTDENNNTIHNTTHHHHHHHGHFRIDNWDTLWWPLDGLRSVLQACPVILFAFSCQVNVCAIFLELPAAEDTSVETNNRQDYNTNDAQSSTSLSVLYHPSKVPLLQRVSCYSVALCTVLYAGMGWTTLADFGPEHVAPNILQNYELRDGLMQVAAAGMAVAVLAAFPLNIFPSRVTCLQWEDAWRKHRQSATATGTTTTATTTIRSSLANADLTEALLQDYRQEQRDNVRNDNAAAVVVPPPVPTDPASTTSIFPDISEGGTPQTDMEPSNDETNTTGPPTPLQQDNNNANNVDDYPDTEVAETTFENEFRVDDDEEDVFTTDWIRHVYWTFILTGTALGLALVVPDISVVFSVLGGTTSSWLGFCVPGLLGLRLGKDAVDEERDWLRYILSWLLLLGGIAIGVLTTILTVQSLTSGH
jgi:amino acid permease